MKKPICTVVAALVAAVWGGLAGCFEDMTPAVHFPDAARWADSSDQHDAMVPLRVKYWEERGKLWQLYSRDRTGASSIREEGLDVELGTFEATAEVYMGNMILCGTGEQARAFRARALSAGQDVRELDRRSSR